MHDRLVTSIIAAKCSWFDATPVGRIINRFSSDIDAVDQEMMFTLAYFMDCVLGTTQVFIAIGPRFFCYFCCLFYIEILTMLYLAMTVPLLLLLLSPIIGFISWSAFLYVQASREMKRLESVYKSPVFVLFSETLSGLSTIRSFGHENRFFDICKKHTDAMNR